MAFNGRFLINMMHFAAQLGADKDYLLCEIGMKEGELSEETCKVENSTYDRLIELCLRESGDPYFGLHAGESMNLSAAGLILQIAQNSSTIKEALEYCCEYANLGCSALPMKLEKNGSNYRILIEPDPIWWTSSPEIVKQTAEGVIAFTIREFTSLSRQQQFPISVDMPWKCSGVRQEYERVFRCAAHFSAKELAINLPNSFVDQAIISSNY